MIDLARGNELGPEEIASRSFPTVRRGIDPEAVRRFLEEVANQLRQLRSTEAEIRRQLTDAQRQATRPVKLDEATLSAAVGTETGRVLQVAHEAAHELVSKAEARATELIASSEATFREHTIAAERRADALLSSARDGASALVAAARDECRTMVEEASEVRRRILADLGDRRRSLHLQLEQLRAGKDTLAKVVDEVAESIAGVRSLIGGAEDEARVAADDASFVDSALEGDLVELTQLVELETVEGVIDELAESIALADLIGGAESQTSEPEFDPAPAVVEVAVSVVEEEAVPVERVDELFAKLRADSDGEGGSAEPPEAVEVPVEAPVAESAGASTLAENNDQVSESVVDEGEEAVAEEEIGDRRLLHRRDELLEPALSSLARTMKRVLASEQNELLDAIRNLSPRDDLTSLWSGDGARSRIATAAAPPLAEAFEAGATFAVQEVGASRSTNAPPKARATGEHALAAAEVVAAGLAGEIVASIERRIGDGLPAGNDGSELAPLVGVAFREWRGTRIEDGAGDSASRAFSLGVAEVARTRKVEVRWIVDDGATPCPDCDDNGLSGSQSVDVAFPTGQSGPPVHPGCRCMLAPTSG